MNKKNFYLLAPALPIIFFSFLCFDPRFASMLSAFIISYLYVLHSMNPSSTKSLLKSQQNPRAIILYKKTPSSEIPHQSTMRHTTPIPYPNFNGEAHETLRVSKEANTKIILNAYCYWTKHSPFKETRNNNILTLSREQVERLTQAKQELLLKRQKMYAA